MIALNEQPGSIRFAVKVVPGASRDRIVGALGDALKISVSKPAQDGPANAAVIKLLAAALGVTAAQITISRGHSSPRKEIAITGLKLADLQRKLESFLK